MCNTHFSSSTLSRRLVPTSKCFDILINRPDSIKDPGHVRPGKLRVLDKVPEKKPFAIRVDKPGEIVNRDFGEPVGRDSHAVEREVGRSQDGPRKRRPSAWLPARLNLNPTKIPRLSRTLFQSPQNAYLSLLEPSRNGAPRLECPPVW